MSLFTEAAEAAEDLHRDRNQFTNNVKASLRGGTIKGVVYQNVLPKS